MVKNVTFYCISSKLTTSDVQCDQRGLCHPLYLPLNSQASSRCFNVILTTSPSLQALFPTWVLIKVVVFFI